MQFLGRAWHILRWPLLVIVLLYIGFVIYRIPAVGEKDRSDKAVAYIHAQKITVFDAMGTNLPPSPDPTEADATVAGVDLNLNGIRDDVELAIFKLHPDSAKVRAAELQYAMALQLMLTQVFDTNTWIAAAQEKGRGYLCIGETIPKTQLNLIDTRTQEIESQMFNTKMRLDAKNNSYNFTTSYSSSRENDCDIDLNTLSN